MNKTKENQPESSWKFPCYGVSKDKKHIVYFIGNSTGTCIYIEGVDIGHIEEPVVVGTQCTDWAMECFEPVSKGKIFGVEV